MSKELVGDYACWYNTYMMHFERGRENIVQVTFATTCIKLSAGNLNIFYFYSVSESLRCTQSLPFYIINSWRLLYSKIHHKLISDVSYFFVSPSLSFFFLLPFSFYFMFFMFPDNFFQTLLDVPPRVLNKTQLCFGYDI